LLERAHADEQRMDSAVRLEVRHAWADLGAAQQRIEVAKAAVAEAEESLEDHSEPLRIRYEQRRTFYEMKPPYWKAGPGTWQRCMTNASPPPCWIWLRGGSRPTRRY
jgi:hypothetical protein